MAEAKACKHLFRESMNDQESTNELSTPKGIRVRGEYEMGEKQIPRVENIQVRTDCPIALRFAHRHD